MNNNTPNNGIWPEHDAQVYERALKYQVYLEYGVSKEDVHKYGLLSYCIRGFKIKEIYDYLVDVGQFVIGKIDRMKPYIWMGGCGPKHKSSLDFKLPIPSQDIKDNGTFYTVYTKAENDSTDEFYMREAEVGKEVTHECPSFGFHTNIQRFSSCKHTIAAVLILAERSADWCNEQKEEFYHGLSVKPVYETRAGLPIHVFGEIPKELMDLYDRCTADAKVTSYEREVIILNKAAQIKRDIGLLTEEQAKIIEPLVC